MGRGVEKARVAFAAAQNGADKIEERRLARLRRCSNFGEVPERALPLSVASEGGGMANTSGACRRIQLGFPRVDYIVPALSPAGRPWPDGAVGVCGNPVRGARDPQSHQWEWGALRLLALFWPSMWLSGH